ncbi:hypothetical protein LOK49_LG05G00479 [Camellia lanceoleosa]|uniref:Uncharacterized protein n=1 Tax=Camellia lanceoleosa TaxID=1840588 RepID=A0ACC0HME4_9ERIC|nr:hypothetical protein LOK49_LG05G00479 [Camellia lanceoleosa]
MRKYIGKIDKFYYEPGTSKQYRSRSQAWARYYETEQQIVVFVPKEDETAHDPHMMEKMKDRTRRFNVDEIANPVTWVLTNIKFDRWTPYIEDEMVLENEQKLWAETFELAMLWKHWPDGTVNAEEEEEDEDEQTKDVDVQSEGATIVEQEEHSAGQAESQGKAVQTEDMHSGN